MTEDEVRELLRRECERVGSVMSWARDNGVSQGYVNDVLLGYVRPGPKVQRALGVRRIAHYDWLPGKGPRG